MLDRKTIANVFIILIVVIFISAFVGFLMGRESTKIEQNQSTTINFGLKDEEKKVNLNKASLEELKSLTGVGDILAKRIIERREIKPFNSIYDVLDVKGIGEEIFKDNEWRICVDN